MPFDLEWYISSQIEQTIYNLEGLAANCPLRCKQCKSCILQHPTRVFTVCKAPSKGHYSWHEQPLQGTVTVGRLFII